MKATLSLILLLSALGTAMAAVSTADRTLLFQDDFDTLSVSQSGKDTTWNYIDYWKNNAFTNWRANQSNDPSLSEIRTEGDASFVTLWGKQGRYHTENTSESNNNKIIGEDVYACGGLFTNKTFTFQYGYVEARARFDSVQGCWPAIWLMPTTNGSNGELWPNNGEIDILEHLNDDPFAYQTLHFFGNDGKSDAKPGVTGSLNNATGGTNDWHTYGMEWTENAISFYVDGTKTGTITGDAYTYWPFGREDNEFYLLIDQQIGGDWPGAPDDAANVTLRSTGAALDIDYIRVYSAENSDSNVWVNGSDAPWGTGVTLADGREWQDGSNMNFSGTTGEISVGEEVSVSHLKVKDDAKVSLKGGTIHATELTLAGDKNATEKGPGTHLNLSGELDVGTLHTAANQWISTVHLTVEDGGRAVIDTVQGEIVKEKVGQAFFSAQGEGTLTIGTLNSTGGVVNINANAADTGRVSITGDANFYQLNLSNGVLELHSDSITTNDKIYLKGGTLLWDGEMNDSKLVYSGGAVKLTSLPSGPIALTGTQKLEMEALGTQATTLAAGTTLRTTGDWSIGSDTSLSGEGTLELASGTVTLNKQLTNDNMVAGIHVKDGATLNVLAKNANGNYSGTVTIDKGGEVRLSSHTAATGGIVPLIGTGGSIVNNGLLVVDESNTSGGNKWVNCMSGTGTVQVACSNVQLNATKAGFTGSVEVSHGGSVTITGAAKDFDILSVADGSMDIRTVGQLTAKELRVAADGTLSAVANAQEATLSVSGLLNAANGSHLNADLVLARGAMLNISGSGAAGVGLIMGSSITLTDNVVLGSDVVHSLANVADTYVLATSMDGFSTITQGVTLDWENGDIRTASNYFTLSDADAGLLDLNRYSLSYTQTAIGDGILALTLTTPEPATATLTLLALSALAARRRRSC